MGQINLTIDSAVRKIIGAYTVINGQIKQLFWRSIVNGKIEDFINYTKILNKTIELDRNSQQYREYPFEIDNFVSVESISVDNGTVTYTIEGNKLIVKCNGGTATSNTYYDPNKYSEYIEKEDIVEIDAAVNPNYPDYKFPPSRVYYKMSSANGLEFKGTVYKQGQGSCKQYDKIGESKVVSCTRPLTMTFVEGVTTTKLPNSITYSEDNFYGNLNYIDDSAMDIATEKYTDMIINKRTGTINISINYTGTVKKPDMRINEWTQKYAGTIYAGGNSYYDTYKYKVDIAYEVLVD